MPSDLTSAFAQVVADLERSGLSRDALATQLETTATTVGRWVRGDRSVPLENVPVVEDLAGLPRGYILRLAGYVSDDFDVRSAIASDPTVDATGREMLLHVYEYARRPVLPPEELAETDTEGEAASARLTAEMENGGDVTVG